MRHCIQGILIRTLYPAHDSKIESYCRTTSNGTTFTLILKLLFDVRRTTSVLLAKFIC